ncbi:hypothetical protein N2152v2_004901 [Parachlorella kessleri]
MPREFGKFEERGSVPGLNSKGGPKLATPNDDDDEGLDDFTFWLYITSCVALVAMAGCMSGLTLGLLSLDTVDLEVLQRPHVLLVTLLVCNAAAAEALPLFLDRLADPVTAVLVSVTVVLLFGEIIPQALCSRYGLQIGATAAPFVRLLMWATWPISWPIGWVLDRVLGERHSALFRRAELKALVDIHKEGLEFGGVLSADEVNIIKGALDMTHKIAKSAMTPMDMVFMLPADAALDEGTLTGILASGHSRIPVHRPGNRGEILGILLVKELILVDKDAGTPVGQIKIRSLPYLRADTPMYDMLKLFEIGRSHMAVLTQPTAAAVERRQREVAARRRRQEEEHRAAHMSLDVDSDDMSVDHSDCSCPASPQASLREYEPSEMEAIGIITIEDVLEELLQSEIVDETDQFIDNLHSERVNAALLARGLPAHLRRVLPTRNMVPRIGSAAFMIAAPFRAASSGPDPSLEEVLAAGTHAAEAGVFQSVYAAKTAEGDSVVVTVTEPVAAAGAAAAAAAGKAGPTVPSAAGETVAASAAAAGNVGQQQRQARVTFGLPKSTPPTPNGGGAGLTTADIEAVAAALSPRTKAAAAAAAASAPSLPALLAHHHHPREDGSAAASQAGGSSVLSVGALRGRGPGGSLHGSAAATAALAAAKERVAAERRSGLPPVPPHRRSRQLTQGIQEQMDLLEPLLLRRVSTADSALLADAARDATAGEEEGGGKEGAAITQRHDSWQ